jgi:hypothetical protein
MADEGIPYPVECLLVPRRYGSGWTIDVQIDGDTIPGVYTDSTTAERKKVVQDALHAVKLLIAARDARLSGSAYNIA